MATLHDRGIEDRMMLCLAEIWKAEGTRKKSIAVKVGVSKTTLWQWRIGGMAFPHSLGRLRQLVEASGAGAKLEIKITHGGDEHTF